MSSTTLALKISQISIDIWTSRKWNQLMHTLGIKMKNRKSQAVGNWKSATEKRKQLSLHISCYPHATPLAPPWVEFFQRTAANNSQWGVGSFISSQHMCTEIFNMLQFLPSAQCGHKQMIPMGSQRDLFIVTDVHRCEKKGKRGKSTLYS